MKHFLLLPAFLLLAFFASCEDTTDEVAPDEFNTNWPERNAAWFIEQLHGAQSRIAEAKAAFGDEWESKCDDRVLPSYAKGSTYAPQDSIVVRIIERGTSNVSPLYTDSVYVNYIGRLIPTESYSLGRVFDHSGLYQNEEEVFNPDFASPAKFLTGNLIEGFSTALQHMHPGDRWQIIIPHETGYGGTANDMIPAYSTLRFEIQLKKIKRN